MKRLRQPYFLFLIIIFLVGLIPAIIGLLEITSYSPLFKFFLMLFLVIVAQNATTSIPVAKRAGITYAITITPAMVPFYGPAAAALAESLGSLVQWLIQPTNSTTWKRNWRQLAFNSGMFSISIYLAGWVLLWTRDLFGAGTLLGSTIPWFIAAVVNVLLNLTLLVTIIYLQQSNSVNYIELWKENLWASQINILITTIGSATLGFAIERYDWIAIVVFFLPILVSAYAFRLYVQQMQSHMDNLENIIAERTTELKKIMKEKDAFLAVLTHDMKSPLTSIGIFIEMIEKFPQIPQQKPDMTRSIKNSQDTLLNIVNNILDLEKMEAEGGIPLSVANFDIVLTCESIVEMIQLQATQKEIQLSFESFEPHLELQGDKSQIERVLQNLISNAIKYTPKAGQICVALKKENNLAVIEIMDRGFGIPEAELPYIFDRFRRVAKHEKVAVGTGLGLAISKAIIESHNGKIEVKSEEGIGSTFTVKLPVTVS